MSELNSPEEILQDTEHRMKQAVASTLHDFGTYRTGRASPVVLERVTVEYYGVETPINQIASVSVPEARQLVISPYEKSMLPVIEKAIQKSDLGINPTNDGTQIRLTFPQMSEDRRKELVKQVHARAEQGKVAVRNVRRDANDHLKALEKAKTITEDQQKTWEQKVQKLSDQYVHEVDDLLKKKDAELMEV
jgi:ribosome recycling factor